MTITRARWRATALLATILSATLALTACSGETDSLTDNDDGATSPSSEGFPVTVDTRFGELTLDEMPERIVVLNGADLDILVSLGVQPIAYSLDDIQDEDTIGEVSPWMVGLGTGEFDPSMYSTEYAPVPEAIAVHNPDLIITQGNAGVEGGTDEELYEQLGEIAPVYAKPFDAEFTWDDQLKALGALTGKSAEAETVLEELEAEFEQARDSLPGIQSATFNGAYGLPDNMLRLVGGYDWLENLGLVLAENQPLNGEAPLMLSAENLPEFAGDVVLILKTGEDTQAKFESDPRFAELPASQNGTVIWADAALSNSINYTGPASIRYALEQIVPLLEDSPLNQNGR